MIWGAGVQLNSVGDLFGWRSIGLWYFAIPMTIFAVVGVVNSINMMDGLDGLGGSIAFIAFAWYALVAANSGLEVQFKTALIFCGAIAGALLGAVGYFGWRLELPEYALFWPFFFGFFAYHFWIKWQWKVLDEKLAAGALSVHDEEDQRPLPVI